MVQENPLHKVIYRQYANRLFSDMKIVGNSNKLVYDQSTGQLVAGNAKCLTSFQ